MSRTCAHGGRLRRLAGEMKKAGLEGAVIVPGPNMLYLTGVNSLLLERPFLLFVPVDGALHLVAPALESGPYRRCGLDLVVHDWTDSDGPDGAFREAAKEMGSGRAWGVEGRAPFAFLHRLLMHANPRLEDAEPILQGLRVVKDEVEVGLLKRSAAILSRAFDELPGFVRDGATERDVGRKMGDAIVENGATGVVDVLVQSGANAADPHALPSGKKMHSGESVVVDISSTLDGYHADVTRTICIGAAKRLESVYARVLEAEELAIGAGGEGVAVGEVDAAARGHLAKAGLGRYFIHRTGHGLGLEVHEAPYIVEAGRDELKERMFFTVEPGAYVPGKLGVRIEDDVMVENGKAVEITTTPKEFGWWR